MLLEKDASLLNVHVVNGVLRPRWFQHMLIHQYRLHIRMSTLVNLVLLACSQFSFFDLPSFLHTSRLLVPVGFFPLSSLLPSRQFSLGSSLCSLFHSFPSIVPWIITMISHVNRRPVVHAATPWVAPASFSCSQFFIGWCFFIPHIMFLFIYLPFRFERFYRIWVSHFIG